ncbi:MAG: hypothetical protein U9N39_10310 [Campylobacterota bacterium]|nr:hypothetical protein [Campylobacterota bacterium]
MRTALALAFVFLFVACGTPEPTQTPSWLHKLTASKKYEVIGYGQGSSLPEAKASAKEEIAQTLISRVESAFVSKTQSAKVGSSESVATLKVTSKLNLNNIKTLKQEQIGNVFYVALVYENLDLAYRVKTTLESIECKRGDSSSYLYQTPLLKKLTATLGCEVAFRLDRRNESWYLKHKEHLFLLSDEEFEELFVSKQNTNFAFVANKKILQDGDSFYFTLKSSKNAYITLLNVYENGIVTLLEKSKRVENSLQIPSKKSENYFEAGVLEEGRDTYDLYVAIMSDKPLDMSRFEYADEELADSELAYKFDELLLKLESYEYSTILLRTKP